MTDYDKKIYKDYAIGMIIGWVILIVLDRIIFH